MIDDKWQDLRDDEIAAYVAWQRAYDEETTDEEQPIFMALGFYENCYGGVVVGGVAEVIGPRFGGVTIGGLPLGVVAGGTAETGGQQTVVPHGGLVAGGISPVTMIDFIDGSGGIVLNGTAIPVVSIPIEGGIVLGGSASLTLSDVIEPSGGVLVGGVALVSLAKTEEVAGGVVAGGVSVVVVGMGVSGGALVGGIADEAFEDIFVPHGGLLAGGLGQVQYDMIAPVSGGVVIGQATYANGFKYRLSITIPASKVSADLHGFVCGYTTDAIDTADIQITDSEGTELASEVRQILERLHVFFKADLSSTVDNIFYVYWS